MLKNVALLSLVSVGLADFMETTPEIDACPMEGMTPMMSDVDDNSFVMGYFGDANPFGMLTPDRQVLGFPYATDVCTSMAPLAGSPTGMFVCDADGMGFTFKQYLGTGCTGTMIGNTHYNMSNMEPNLMFNCGAGKAYAEMTIVAASPACTNADSAKAAVGVCMVTKLPPLLEDLAYMYWACDTEGVYINFFSFAGGPMCPDDAMCLMRTFETATCSTFLATETITVYGKPGMCMLTNSDDGSDDGGDDSSALGHALFSAIAIVTALQLFY